MSGLPWRDLQLRHLREKGADMLMIPSKTRQCASHARLDNADQGRATHRVSKIGSSLNFSCASLLVLLFLLMGRCCSAQSVNHLSWLDRASKTRSDQPDWVTPLITSSANLEEATIYDTSRKLQSNGTDLVTAGGPRGIQFVPFGRLQVTIGATPYLAHNDPRVRDGFGDTSFAFKYRMASGNAEHGGFAFSGQIGASIPTGSHQNGQPSAILTPTLLGEKGWGNFNIQSTFGFSLPLGDAQTNGRQFTSNTAFQSHLFRVFYPELETNALGYWGGKNDGQRQVLFTPGLLVGRFPVARSAGITFGIGMQVAATRDHAYNHNLIFSIRIPLQSHLSKQPNHSLFGTK